MVAYNSPLAGTDMKMKPHSSLGSLHSNAKETVTNYTAQRTLFWPPYLAAMGKKKEITTARTEEDVFSIN